MWRTAEHSMSSRLLVRSARLLRLIRVRVRAQHGGTGASEQAVQMSEQCRAVGTVVRNGKAMTSLTIFARVRGGCWWRRAAGTSGQWRGAQSEAASPSAPASHQTVRLQTCACLKGEQYRGLILCRRWGYKIGSVATSPRELFFTQTRCHTPTTTSTRKSQMGPDIISCQTQNETNTTPPYAA